MATLLGQRRTLIPNRRVIAAHKPFLWLTKGTYRGNALQDVIRSDGYDKSFHDHGQGEGEFAHLIKHLTQDGDTVLDCFVGGGSVAAAAIKLGRQFIGIDLRRENVEMTRRRIEDVLRGIH